MKKLSYLLLMLFVLCAFLFLSCRTPDQIGECKWDYQKKLMEQSPYTLPAATARKQIVQRQKSLLEATQVHLPEPGEDGWGVDPEDKFKKEEK